MFYVYILESKQLDSHYVGFSHDLKSRLEWHQSGRVKTTSKVDDFQLIWYAAFRSKEKALAFEKYLKKGSGFAFKNKRLI